MSVKALDAALSQINDALAEYEIALDRLDAEADYDTLLVREAFDRCREAVMQLEDAHADAFD